jgi:type IV pilus assembly protein PilX
MNKRLNSRGPAPSRVRQRGVVLLFSLIALVIMLIVAVALVRSFNNSLFTAGNIGFKRDLQNQSEAAVDKVLTAFKTGGALATAVDRKDNKAAANYSATMLATNAQGIPDALKDNTTFAVVGSASNDFTPAGAQVKVRYLIDRLCAVSGDETTFTAADSCRIAGNPIPAGTSLTNLKSADRTINGAKGAATQAILYRVSIKVTGPRNTQSFFQSTFTVPST